MNYLKEMAEGGYNSETIGDFHRFMVPTLARLLGVKKDGMILDIGAGQGHAVISLHDAGYKNITVVDKDPFNFDYFKSRYGFRCCRCDVAKERVPIEDGRVAWIIQFHLIEHLDEPSSLMKECRRLLIPGGVMTLVTPDWRKQFKTFWRDPTHIHPYDKESMGRLFRMHDFQGVQVFSWGGAWGLGRIRAYRLWSRMGMIGRDMMVIGRGGGGKIV